MGELRVVHVIDNLTPGGTERQCVELVRGLSAKSVQNAVFYFRTGRLLEELETLGITARAFRLGSFRSPRFPLRLIRLARAIRRWAPQAVQTYGFYSNLPGLLAGALARVPVRIAGCRDLGTHLRPAQRRANRWAWSLAHRVVANSEAVRRQLIGPERVASDKVVVIRNGLNLAAWSPLDRSVHDTGETVVGMVANFREQKDHVTFLTAAKEILTVIPSARFCLVGSGVLETATREHAMRLGIASRVEFLGCLEGDALRAAMGRFHVSVLTSKTEGLPNVVLESMAVGLPVVATAVGGTTEIIEDGVSGFLIPPEAPTVLAERVICLLKDPWLARRLSERGRYTVEREFAADRMVGRFHGLYLHLLGEPRAEESIRVHECRP